MKIIFLDIDGVLNGHDYNEAAKSCNIRPECVREFNRILRETDAKIVISSAWRYMIHRGAMTIKGFEYMLRTHGVECEDRIIGITCTDETEGFKERGLQIGNWLWERRKIWNAEQVDRYVVIDDELFDIVDEGHPIIQTNGKQGLDDLDACMVIEYLERSLERILANHAPTQPTITQTNPAYPTNNAPNIDGRGDEESKRLKASTAQVVTASAGSDNGLSGETGSSDESTERSLDNKSETGGAK